MLLAVATLLSTSSIPAFADDAVGMAPELDTIGELLTDSTIIDSEVEQAITDHEYATNANESSVTTFASTTGTVTFDHDVSSTHENDAKLKISWSSTSGNTVYYSVAVKALDGYPQFTYGAEDGSIIGKYNGIFQKSEYVTINASALPDPGTWIKVFVKGYARDKTTVTDEGAYVYFLIEESPKNYYASLSRSEYNADAAGTNDVKVKVKANIDWSLDCSASDWITLSTDSGSGNDTFYFSIAPNKRAVSRSATIYLMDSGRYNTYGTLKIKQEAAAEKPYLTISPTTISDYDGLGGSYTIDVSSNVNWEARVGKSGKGWISIDQSNGVGNASVKVIVSKNDTGAERSAKVLVDSVDGDIINDITVTQSAMKAAPSIDTTNATLDKTTYYPGDTITINGIWVKNAVNVHFSGNLASVGTKDVKVSASKSWQNLGSVSMAIPSWEYQYGNSYYISVYAENESGETTELFKLNYALTERPQEKYNAPKWQSSSIEIDSAKKRVYLYYNVESSAKYVRLDYKGYSADDVLTEEASIGVYEVKQHVMAPVSSYKYEVANGLTGFTEPISRLYLTVCDASGNSLSSSSSAYTIYRKDLLKKPETVSIRGWGSIGSLVEGVTIDFYVESTSSNVTLYIDAFNGVTGERYTAATEKMNKSGSMLMASHKFVNADRKIIYAVTADGTKSDEEEIIIAAAEPTPTIRPTITPTIRPTATPRPTNVPTSTPTARPTNAATPTYAPTSKPTDDTVNSMKVSSNGKRLNMRKAASTSSSIVAKLNDGDRVEVLSTKDDWCYIRANVKGSIVEGYVFAKYLQADSKPTPTPGTTSKPDSASTNARVSTNGSKLKLRARASSSGSVITRIPNGASLTVLETVPNWYYVQYSDANGKIYKGWVASQYVAMVYAKPTVFDPVWPCSSAYTITCLYYYKSGALHGTKYGYLNAMDISGNGDIIAVESGTIEVCKNDKDFGNYIIIDHGNGKKSLYAHLASFKDGIKKGVVVNKGDKIGVMGSTGNATGTHLHFEMSDCDPWWTYYYDKYKKTLKYENNVYENNRKYNEDTVVVVLLENFYKKTNGIWSYSE